MTVLERMREVCQSVKVDHKPVLSWQARSIKAKEEHIQAIRSDSHFTKADLEWITRIRREIVMLKREMREVERRKNNPHLYN